MDVVISTFMRGLLRLVSWYWDCCPGPPPIMQGLSIPFACVGSGDPVRVLCLYTTNTLDIFQAFIAEAYVQLVATGSTVLCSSLML